MLPEVAALLDIQVPPPMQSRPKRGLCDPDLVSPLLERVRPPESVLLGEEDLSDLNGLSPSKSTKQGASPLLQVAGLCTCTQV